MIIKSKNPRQPEGAVLVFALIVMMLMGLMSAAIFLGTRTELDISKNTNMGRDAFTKADATARLAVQLTRVLLNPSLGGVEGYFTDNPGPFTVEIGDNFDLNSMMDLAGEGREEDVRNRYLAATAIKNPQLIVKYKGQTVGTAAVAVTYLDPPPGASLDGSMIYGDAAPQSAAIIVTATGRVPQFGETAASDYFSGSIDAPHSVVTTIFQDKVN